MKRALKERVKLFFSNIGGQNIPLRRVFIYFKSRTKRFVCTAFILLCFMVGNSFAHAASQEEKRFVFGGDRNIENVIAVKSDMAAADEQQAGAGTTESVQPEETEDKLSSEPRHAFDRDDWRLVLINKQHPIPEDYSFSFGAIKTIKGNMKCDKRIIDDLLSMMEDAGGDGVNLAICSPYRDLNYQQGLFNRKIKAYMDKGMSYMEAYSISSQTVTVPGTSEHQIGLAIDIVSDTYIALDEGFAETDAGLWLEEHCAEYGFILRYPKGKEYITGIEFEPWHFRYVGKEAAAVIMEQGLCLEEFWDKYL